MRTIKIISVLVLLSLAVTSCGAAPKNTNTTQKTINIQKFEIDNNTIRLNDTIYSEFTFSQLSKNVSSTQLKNKEYLPEDYAGEVTLVNEDTSTLYKVIGDDIMYNNTLYYNLASEMKKVNTKFDNKVLINLIVKTYKTQFKEVDCHVIENMINTESDEPSLEERLLECDKYQRLIEKYNEHVKYDICLIDGPENQANIYVADSYILIMNIGGDIELDMSNYTVK